jgi:hypothetical protein
VPVEHGETDLRGVGIARELRLDGESPADRDAVAAPDQVAVAVPDFERMRVAGDCS